MHLHLSNVNYALRPRRDLQSVLYSAIESYNCKLQLHFGCLEGQQFGFKKVFDI